MRCLVCQGQSISDSNSDFAQTIKLVVKDLIDEGKTEDEIYEFMSDTVPDFVLVLAFIPENGIKRINNNKYLIRKYENLLNLNKI